METWKERDLRKMLSTGGASIQWLFFMFANTVVVPVSVGAAFELSGAEIAMTLRSSLILTGIACVLQGIWGHRYPLMEGHSGLMWGLLLHISTSASALGMSYQEIGGGIASGMLAAAVFTAAAGWAGWASHIRKIFTPMVMSVYLFLLSVQLVFIFFSGMMKLTSSGQLDIAVSLYSVAIVLFVSALKIKGRGIISHFSILIGIVVGWGLYMVLFSSEAATSGGRADFHWFPLGAPNLEWGIVLTTFVAGVINMSNTIASVQAAGLLLKEPPSNDQMNRSFALTGLFTGGAAFLGLVPYAPFTSSIGFLESTRMVERLPFIIGGVLFSLLGIIPAAGELFATLPITVGSAVLFVAYLQLFGSALKSLDGTDFHSNTIFRIAAPVLTGISIMMMDPEIFSSLPIYIQPLFTNGLIIGVLLSAVLERFVRWEEQ
ncbi:uracil/xanthine transporter [Bacillus xiapuensis]|uniref:uracil/xanthine transporter n=1 Tax=Bacillus xiapuensis TaxID=2014075 RepID=UPI001E3D332D|nr:uracil/xanthine transporter [Bacillus xiapuensis]